MRCIRAYPLRWALLLAVAMPVLPASAACFICDEVVTLNAEQAACFADHFPEVLEAIRAAPDGRAMVNLNSCAEGKDKITVRAGLGDMPEPPKGLLPDGSWKLVGKSAYLLDVAGAECLSGLIARHEGPFDPSTTFDLFEMCQQ